MTAVISELISYPVKGCAGVWLSETGLGYAGLAHDRGFLVVDENGTFRSQRRDPRLALIRPAIDTCGERLTLRAPGFDDLRIAVDLASPRREVDLFGQRYRGIDQGDAPAEWLSSVLGKASRLVRVPPEHDRVTDGRTPGTSGYADSSAVHVISRASLDELNRRLNGPPIPMSRFRPNIVIDGWDEPHLEDRVHRMVVGDAELGYAKLAIRCAVTLVDQRSGGKSGPEPLRTLATYRRAAAGGVAFGAKFSVLRPGTLAVGDAPTVPIWADSQLSENVPG
ncbi:MOSC N-terminal beta barrel domain-containing protein [Sphaerisporangium sp. TRM90804]|uniref:MOSC domain-containing protein n=1 Tax=Sphaerisporangium sp. TRM90804 TaxID=3031113 RepID=UPI00244ABCD2|nr:MOSC N-terminal beta barrel domain-containing protein [Sphaerisporangium sp. TRM90804]MDH2429871.1 MOSC N-terminal beta barrel domain-containing protein [Sphaerisporangium sp. TRM90804]